MKTITVIIVLLALTSPACKTFMPDERVIQQQPNTDTILKGKNLMVIGTTRNGKGGAVISNNYGVFIIEGLHEWESNALEKKVCVWGDVEPIVYENQGLVIADDTFRLAGQRYRSMTYRISNSRWALQSDSQCCDTIR